MFTYVHFDQIEKFFHNFLRPTFSVEEHHHDLFHPTNKEITSLVNVVSRVNVQLYTIKTFTCLPSPCRRLSASVYTSFI